MADWPMESLGGGTPLSCAKTPVMDALAKVSEIGTVATYSGRNGSGKRHR